MAAFWSALNRLLTETPKPQAARRMTGREAERLAARYGVKTVALYLAKGR